METLKLKIFDVLTEKIPVSEFENWLYDSEEILDNLGSNCLYFDVISVNYKLDNWTTNLKKIIENHLSNDFLEIVRIEKICSEILVAENFEDTYQILKKTSKNFDYDSWFSILWELYRLKDYFELATDGIFNKDELLNEAKFYSKETLNIINKISDFNLIKNLLEQKIKPFKTLSEVPKHTSKTTIKHAKLTLKQKILAFFKKS